MPNSSTVIERCPVRLQADALRKLHAGLSPDQQSALPGALDSIRSQGEDAFAGLFVARQDEKILQTAWLQLAPGRTAILWPPALQAPESASLLQVAAEFVDQRQIPLAQLLISPDASQNTELLRHGGYEKLVDLEYLSLEADRFPNYTGDKRLQFVAATRDTLPYLGQLLLETYQGTLDCPQINGLRHADDILAGYRAQGVFDPKRWFFVRQRDDVDVGALLLTEYSPSGTWELIYMGVLPQARGNGFGKRIVQFAIALAKDAGAERLVLAADSRNQPALTLYREAGLVTWDRRRVYARLRPEFSNSG